MKKGTRKMVVSPTSVVDVVAMLGADAGLRRRWEESIIPEPMTGCWLWTASERVANYGNFHVRRRNFLAHRVSLALASGPAWDESCFACHRCDNTWCVNPDHLYMGDHDTNARDCTSRGRRKALRGEASPSAKLTREQASEIKTLMRRSGRDTSEIAARFGVSPALAYHIHRGWTWKELGGDDAHR